MHNSKQTYAAQIFGHYDILGYFMPALALVGCCVLAEVIYEGSPTPMISLLGGSPLEHGAGSVIQLGLMLVGALTLYLIGHIVSAFSSVAIDRILNARVFGYPYQTLLFPKWPRQRTTHSAYFWLAIALVLNVYFGIILCRVYGLDTATDCALDLPFAQVVVGWVFVAAIAWKVAMRWLVILLERFSTLECANRVTRWALLYPFRVLSIPAGLACDFGRMFVHPGDRGLGDPSEEMPSRIRDRYLRDFGMQLPADDGCAHAQVTVSRLTNAYWLPSLYVSDKCPHIWKTCLQFLRLYSFARNASTAFYGAFIYSLALPLARGDGLRADPSYGHFCLALWVLSFLLIFRYYYLYHSYYSRFLFRAYYYASTQETGF